MRNRLLISAITFTAIGLLAALHVTDVETQNAAAPTPVAAPVEIAKAEVIEPKKPSKRQPSNITLARVSRSFQGSLERVRSELPTPESSEGTVTTHTVE